MLLKEVKSFIVMILKKMFLFYVGIFEFNNYENIKLYLFERDS